MHIAAAAIICSVLAHGEHGAVVRVMTGDHGLQAGYVRGGRSRRLRPVLLPGNVVEADLRARTEATLAAMTVELAHSRAPLMTEPLAAAGIDWVTALTAAALPEGQPYPHLHAGLEAVLSAIEAAPAARGWVVALVRYEQLLLAELGFGLSLAYCVVSGSRDDLTWVSPKSGAAVSRVAGEGYADRLLPLPPFMFGSGMEPSWSDIVAGLRITGHFLSRDLLVDRAAAVLVARDRLLDRLKRLV